MHKHFIYLFNFMHFKNENCTHEDNINYHELTQIDGVPQYHVSCDDCGAEGTIFLSETSEEWDKR